jgi:hypothetical protein
MDKVKQLADELYNRKVLDGWENVSMETCLNRASGYYRMDEVVKKLTIPVVSNSVICECGAEMFKVIPQPYCCKDCGKRK